MGFQNGYSFGSITHLYGSNGKVLNVITSAGVRVTLSGKSHLSID